MAKKLDKIINPIDASFEEVAKTLVSEDFRPTLKDNKNNELVVNTADLVPPPTQGDLFHVEKQVEINGIEMGILENRLPYLTESGLARMCGIDRKVLNRLARYIGL